MAVQACVPYLKPRKEQSFQSEEDQKNRRLSQQLVGEPGQERILLGGGGSLTSRPCNSRSGPVQQKVTSHYPLK